MAKKESRGRSGGYEALRAAIKAGYRPICIFFTARSGISSRIWCSS